MDRTPLRKKTLTSLQMATPLKNLEATLWLFTKTRKTFIGLEVGKQECIDMTVRL
jgi:hypothetical protein